MALAVAVAGLIGLVAGLGFRPARKPVLAPASGVATAPVEAPAVASPAVLRQAEDAAALEPRSVLGPGGKRPLSASELSAQRADALRRFRELIDLAPRLLDSDEVSLQAKRSIYDGIARVRLLDRMLMLHDLPRIGGSGGLGRTFGSGERPGLDLARAELGLASEVLKFRQIGVELPGLIKDLIEESAIGVDRVRVDLSTPARELKWAAVHVRTNTLTRRDVLWVTVNDLSLMLDDHSVATRDAKGWVLCHFVDPRLLRTTGNTIAVAHEALPGEGSASLMRISGEVGIAGGVQKLP